MIIYNKTTKNNITNDIIKLKFKNKIIIKIKYVYYI